MYGRSSPVRPWASWTVATPSWPSVRITSTSARLTLRTIVGFTFAPSHLRTFAPSHPRPVAPLRGQCLVHPRIDLACVALEDLLLCLGRDRGGVNVAFRVVVIVSRLGIDAAHRAD